MKRKIFFGWWVVLACGIAMFARGGIVFYPFSVFLKELTQAFDWSRGEVSLALTIQTTMMALLSPVAGLLSDKRGPRQVMLAGCLALGAAYLALSRMDALWQFYLLYFIIGVGYAIVGPVSVGVAISNWFSRYRGTALGTAAIGIGIGGFIGVPLTERLVATLGWRWAYLGLGLLLWAMTLPAMTLLMRNRPEERGLLPDGALPPDSGNPGLSEEETRQKGTAPKPPVRPAGLSRAEALRCPGFWILAFAFFLIGLGNIAAMVHQVPCLTDRGFSTRTAAFILGLTIGFSSFARFGFGLLADRVNLRLATVLDYLLVAAGIALLLVASSVWMLYLFAVVMGLGVGGIVVLMTLITRQWFGAAAYGEIFGYLHLAFVAGIALGPVLAGYIFDITGAYTWAFVPGIALVLLAALAISLARVPLHATAEHPEVVLVGQVVK
ncbi:MAG: MFS transporter [Candidatus Tectomicrobia bacterium]|uniref:MFS transporter n=1 Tax=Tectimicrobiota bacterium TaxID=2528274 RepID=A0A932FXB1_UNCTE|nr:MFS transporter [Candidatus Tectomicrobia bacterium]